MLLTVASTYDQIVSLISSVGFPIVVCGYLLWSQRDERNKHAEESKGFVEAINNNTTILEKLLERMKDE